jgi:hypothetical protein
MPEPRVAFRYREESFSALNPTVAASNNVENVYVTV